MNRALFHKALADLRSHRLQTALILLILTAATATLALAATIQRSMNNPWERTFAESNGAHLSFFSDTAEVDLTSISRLEGVSATAGPFPVVWEHSLVKDHEKYSLLLYGMPSELPAVGRPLVTEGRWLAAEGEDEIVLDRSFARHLSLKVGDRVDILSQQGKVTLSVVGLAVNSGWGLYPNFNPALVYVLQSTLARLETDADKWGSALWVRLFDPEASQEFQERAYALFPEGAIEESLDWHDIREWTNFTIKIMVLFLGVFSVFALFAVGFIVANAIGGVVLSQYREIGLLKAVGFTPGQVTLLFLVEHLGLGLVAGVAGLLLGTVIAPLFLRPTAELLNAPAMPVYDPALYLAVLVGVEVIVALFTIWPAWRGGRIGTVQAITVGFARVRSKSSRLARLATRLRLPPVVALGVKDAFARPLRALLTIAGLALTVLTVTFSLGMETSIQVFSRDPALRGIPYDMAISRGYLSDVEARRILEAHSEVSAYYSITWGYAQVEGQTESINTRALGGAYDQFRIIIPEGRMFSAPGEAVVGMGLLDWLDLKVGDELRLTMDGKPLDLRIVGRYVEMNNMGQMAMYSLETLQQVDPQAEPDAYALKLTPGADAQALEAALLRESSDQFNVEMVDKDPPKEIGQVRVVIFGLNIVLVSIGLISLFNTTLLGVRERLRDFGILKTVGLTPRQIVVSVMTGMSLLALLAVLVGIPLGLIVTRLLFDYLGRQMGMGAELGMIPPWWWLALLAPGALLVSILGSVIPARQAAQVRVVEVLRYE